MEYTMMGKLNERVSRLGFGCMRFPTNPDGSIDEPRAEAMLRRAYESGVTYFDTAYFYHNRTSEAFVGRVLKQFPRESFKLATKLPLGIIETVEQAKEIFEGQFKTMDVEYFDYYLLHAINGKKFDWVVENGIIDWLAEEQKKGRIRHLGFSFHDSYEAFERIITYRDWDFCQIQFNYMDVDVQAGMKGYELAKKLGIPMIIMEPVKGGSLATLSEDIVSIFKAEKPSWSVAAWAMRWLKNLDNCHVILSGMSTEEQVEDNLATFAEPGGLCERGMQVVDRVREAIRAKMFVGCTACRYCMPCPFGVDIPKNFRMMNDFAMYNNRDRLERSWEEMKEEERAGSCRRCGACEKACPQQLPIREKLAEMAAVMNR